MLILIHLLTLVDAEKEMAKSRLKKIQRDVSDIYESIPEGTIPAALEAINEQ